ncbi:MAG: flagellar hook-basal body complex protein FliE [Thermotogae bacterium]|nr:flagellar hook-basal body complex protein FliE [Thermotogota bacterium]
MIERIQPIGNEGVSKITKIERGKEGKGFKELLVEAIDKVNESQKEAQKAAIDFAAGKISSIHEVILKAEKATMMLRLTAEVRNRIVEAYRDIMRMQI